MGHPREQVPAAHGLGACENPRSSPDNLADDQFCWQSGGLSLDLMDSDLETVVVEQLQERLQVHSRTLDLSTPKDGHCLFHALRKGGLLSDLNNELTVKEMRALALSNATEEQLQVIAAEWGVTVDVYKQRMRNDYWGDNLMIALLAAVFERPITVVSPSMTRTFAAHGVESNMADDEAVWVAYNNQTHYYGVLPDGAAM